MPMLVQFIESVIPVRNVALVRLAHLYLTCLRGGIALGLQRFEMGDPLIVNRMAVARRPTPATTTVAAG